jgi:hypothetical protein
LVLNNPHYVHFLTPLKNPEVKKFAVTIDGIAANLQERKIGTQRAASGNILEGRITIPPYF